MSSHAVPYPIPDTVVCPFQGCSFHTTKAHHKIRLTAHLQTVHNNSPLSYLLTCGLTVSTAMLARNHFRSCVVCNPPAGAIPTHTPNSEYDESSNIMTLPYPARPTVCSICSRFETNTHTTGKVTSSLSHHAFHAHGNVSLTFLWKCSTCGFTGDGYKLRDHTCSSGHRITNRGGKTRRDIGADNTSSISGDTIASTTAASASATTTSSADGTIAMDLSTSALNATIRDEINSTNLNDNATVLPSFAAAGLPASTQLDNSQLSSIGWSQLDPPTNLGMTAALQEILEAQNQNIISPTTNLINQAAEVLSPTASPHSTARPPPSAPLPQSPPDEQPSINNTQEPSAPLPSVYTTDEEKRTEFWSSFQQFWIAKFSECDRPSNLNLLITAFTKNLVASFETLYIKAADKPKQPSSAKNSKNRRPIRPRIRRCPRQISYNGREASAIQREFVRFPSRAIRKICEDAKPAFAGNTEDAAKDLQRIYGETSPHKIEDANNLFSGLNWQQPDQKKAEAIGKPITAEEIASKLKRAKNTSPGEDRVEYRHLKAADKDGLVLECLYKKLLEWQHVPPEWKKGRTILIHKKGDASKIENFRPITLLSVLYKIFSGTICSRLSTIAIELDWLSSCQKGFIPKSQGLAEHTFGLSALQQEQSRKHQDYHLCFLDLANAFGSVPHAIIHLMIGKLNLPCNLSAVLHEIYRSPSTTFRLPDRPTEIKLVSGVLQGDPLSTIIFNLCLEPVLRTANTCSNRASINGHSVGVSAFADDIALAYTSSAALQQAVSQCANSATTLGLRFRPNKCATISHEATDIFLYGEKISRVTGSDTTNYLGVPFGVAHLFLPSEKFIPLLDRITGSLLAPWQKIEAVRTFVIPSISYSLSSGYCRKERLAEFDSSLHNALRRILDLPDNSAISHFHSARQVGGLGIPRLSQEADIWTLARAVRLLSSTDASVMGIASHQICANLTAAKISPSNNNINAYLSGSQSGDLVTLRHSSSPLTLWSRARAAASRLGVKVDLSESPRIIVDEITATPKAMVKALHMAIKSRYSTALCSLSTQGQVSNCLKDDKEADKDIPLLISSKTPLSFSSYNLSFLARLSLLPSRGKAGNTSSSTKCRHCEVPNETTAHICSGCKDTLLLARSRHDNLLGILKNKVRPDFTVQEEPTINGLRPDLLVTNPDGDEFLVEATVSWDTQLVKAHETKIAKYAGLPQKTLPLVIGALGTWHPANNAIQAALRLNARTWKHIRRTLRASVIEGTCAMIRQHLRGVRLTRPVDV